MRIVLQILADGNRDAATKVAERLMAVVLEGALCIVTAGTGQQSERDDAAGHLADVLRYAESESDRAGYLLACSGGRQYG